MRNIFLMLLIFLGQTIIAQPFNQTDAQGRKIGKWKKVYSNGKIRYQGQFDKNNPQGVFKYYNSNGQLTSVLTYSKDGKSSSCKMYYVKGQLRATGYYYNQKKDSTWLYYAEVSQKIIAEENYNKGVKNGAWKIIAMEPSFHGRTSGSLSLTGQIKYQDSFLPLLPGISFAEFNNFEKYF